MTRRVVRKSASAKKPRRELTLGSKRVVPDAIQSPEANAAEMTKTRKEKPEPAKRVAKVVNLIVSVGNEDERSYEEFLADLRESIGAVEPPFMDKDGNRKPGPHVALSGGYYILDGKVCRPEDYDPKNRAFKRGTFPPSWAGGPTQKSMTQAQQMDYDYVNLTEDEYDKKYQLGKYEPPRPPNMQQRGESEAEWRARMQKAREERELAEVEALEEFDFDEDDLMDDDKMGAIADESASSAVKKLQGKKRVVKKKPAAKRKVVRRK